MQSYTNWCLLWSQQSYETCCAWTQTGPVYVYSPVIMWLRCFQIWVFHPLSNRKCDYNPNRTCKLNLETVNQWVINFQALFTYIVSVFAFHSMTVWSNDCINDVAYLQTTWRVNAAIMLQGPLCEKSRCGCWRSRGFTFLATCTWRVCSHQWTWHQQHSIPNKTLLNDTNYYLYTGNILMEVLFWVCVILAFTAFMFIWLMFRHFSRIIMQRLKSENQTKRPNTTKQLSD